MQFVFMTFEVSKIVRNGRSFGFQQWQLLSIGNSFSVALGGGLQMCNVIL